MGLGTKIKEALHGDRHEARYASNQSQMPGTFDNGEVPERPTDGKPYTAPHGTLVDDQDGITGTGLTHSDKHRSRHAKDINEQWEATGENRDSFKPGHRSRDSGVGLTDPTATSALDSTTQGNASAGGYWGDMPSRHDTTKSRDLPDRSATHGRDAEYDNRFADQAVGGGVYNPAASTNTRERAGSRGGHLGGGLTNDPLTSSGRDNTYSHTGRNDDLQGMEGGYRGDDLRTSGRNDHAGLRDVGVATGAAGAAGYAAHEFSHRDQRNSIEGHNQGRFSGEPAPGMPRSSMLDPEPAQPGLGGSSRQQQQQPVGENFSSGGYNASPIDKNRNDNFNNKPNSPTTGLGNSGPGSSARHFGPGHEGSKVMHTCEHCGRDNDISKYFSKDVVYRLGS